MFIAHYQPDFEKPKAKLKKNDLKIFEREWTPNFLSCTNFLNSSQPDA